MDNKQNRQFYWEVKDFMGKKPEVHATKPFSLKEAINSVVGKNNIYRQNNYNPQMQNADTTSALLKSIGSAEKRYNPGSVAFGKNNPTNPFNLNETWYNPSTWFSDYKPRQQVMNTTTGQMYTGGISAEEVKARQNQAAINRVNNLIVGKTPEQIAFEREASGRKDTDQEVVNKGLIASGEAPLAEPQPQQQSQQPQPYVRQYRSSWGSDPGAAQRAQEAGQPGPASHHAYAGLKIPNAAQRGGMSPGQQLRGGRGQQAPTQLVNAQGNPLLPGESAAPTANYKQFMLGTAPKNKMSLQDILAGKMKTPEQQFMA